MPNFPRQIAETDEATGLIENAKASKKGGKIAKDARLKLEEQTGKKNSYRRKLFAAIKRQKKIEIITDQICELSCKCQFVTGVYSINKSFHHSSKTTEKCLLLVKPKNQN